MGNGVDGRRGRGNECKAAAHDDDDGCQTAQRDLVNVAEERGRDLDGDHKTEKSARGGRDEVWGRIEAADDTASPTFII